MRLCGGGLEHGRHAFATLLRPIAHKLAGIVSASLGRQHLRVARGVVLVALAFSFATSTAVFNTTYNAQARVDAELTNGSDVTVTGSSAFAPGSMVAQLKALQGLLPSNPCSIALRMWALTCRISMASIRPYWRSHEHVQRLFRQWERFFGTGRVGCAPRWRTGFQETVTNYQLNMGDQINLRLQSGSDHQYHVIPFHFLGVVREFPTAPRTRS